MKECITKLKRLRDNTGTMETTTWAVADIDSTRVAD